MDERVARCRLVAGLIAADGQFRPEERFFLERTMRRFGLSEAEQEEALEGLTSDDAAEVAARLPEADRRALMTDLATAAAVDGHLHTAEEQFLERVAEAMGLESEYVNEAREAPDHGELRDQIETLAAMVEAYGGRQKKR